MTNLPKAGKIIVKTTDEGKNIAYPATESSVKLLGNVEINNENNSHVLVMNQTGDKWINGRVSLQTQVKDRSTTRAFYDFKGPLLTTSFPNQYSGNENSNSYPPNVPQVPGSIYINTTEKVVFISNHSEPHATETGVSNVAGKGSNAMTAYIIGLLGASTDPDPALANYKRPPLVKFVASKSDANTDDPVRQIIFRPAENTGHNSSPADTMPDSSTTANAHYGTQITTHAAWSWFRYEQSPFDAPIMFGDIITNYTRWWTSSDTHEAIPTFIRLSDVGDFVRKPGAPLSTDDVDHQFTYGSIIINTDIDEAWMCMNPATGAAVWKKITSP